MRIVRSFPQRIRLTENLWIRLRDGTRLSARLWLPDGAAKRPVPAILEYLPYRHRDGTYPRDGQHHAYFAGNGYASIRVDMRGSGDSDGILYDEYLKQELDDAVEVIAWLARQPWCDGNVGMMGISWGGFNALQVAALRPPELGAIVTVCSTDDRYADDTHYMGGALLGGNMGWGCTMFAFNARPPDPAVVGRRWRRMWLERLKKTPHFVESWMRHPRRDAFWRHGSVCEDYGAIRCPVYVVGGWEDAYTNAVPRLLAGLTVPRKGLIGPWAHSYPHRAHMHSIGFLQECLAWWDRWLKRKNNDVMHGPMLRVWMQESVPPLPQYKERPGRWVGEPLWPSPRIRPKVWTLAPGRLTPRGGPHVALAIRSPATTGAVGGTWCPYGNESDMPTDQREDDGNSLCFDTAPLRQRLEVLGAPQVRLSLSVDRPLAQICVRLCDVDPTGASTRVSYMPLNLCHRDGHTRPKRLVPGRRYAVNVRLCDIGHAFLPGHRIRVAVSTSYWPMIWPSPEPATVTLYAGSGSRLTLPVRRPRASDRSLPPFGPALGAAPQPMIELTQPKRHLTVDRDLASEVQVVTMEKSRGKDMIPTHGLTFDAHGIERYTVHPRDPLSAVCEIAWTTEHQRGRWHARAETWTRLTSTRNHFRLEARLEAFEGRRRVCRRRWNLRIPRDHL